MVSAFLNKLHVYINSKITGFQFQIINADRLESLGYLRYGLFLLFLLFILMLDLKSKHMRTGHIIVHNILEALSYS